MNKNEINPKFIDTYRIFTKNINEKHSNEYIIELIENEIKNNNLNRLEFLEFLNNITTEFLEKGLPEKEVRQLLSILDWCNEQILFYKNPDIENFKEITLKILEEIKPANNFQISFIIKNALKSIKNKGEFIYYLKYTLNDRIRMFEDIISKMKIKHDEDETPKLLFSKENLGDYYFLKSKKDLNNEKFALKIINELDLVNEFQNNFEPEPKNQYLTSTQKLLLIALLQKFKMFPRQPNTIPNIEFNEFIGSITGENENTIKKAWVKVNEILDLKITTGQKNSKLEDLKKVKDSLKVTGFTEIEQYIDTLITKIGNI